MFAWVYEYTSVIIKISDSLIHGLNSYASLEHYRREWKHPDCTHQSFLAFRLYTSPSLLQVSSLARVYLRVRARLMHGPGPIKPIRRLQVSYQCQLSENDVSGNSTRNTRSLLWEFINIVLYGTFTFLLLLINLLIYLLIICPTCFLFTYSTFSFLLPLVFGYPDLFIPSLP